MPDQQHPPMDPNTSEASKEQLALARAQGEAYGRALEYMVRSVADTGGSTESGDYRIGYAVEKAEGMYEWSDGELVWQEPGDTNLHVEVAVCDRSDGRFIPAVKVLVTLTASDGTTVGTHEQPLLWHPMLYHYGRNWKVPGDGDYTLTVRVEPPTFMRHDETNGQRFQEPVEVTFENVSVSTGQD